MPAPPPPARKPWIPLLAFTLVAVSFGVGGYLLYASERDDARARSLEGLGAVADLKVRQIVAWLAERRADAAVITATPVWARKAQRLFALSPDPRDRGELARLFAAFREHLGYDGLYLLDAKGQVHLGESDGGGGPGGIALSLFAEALRTEQVIVSDLHRAAPTKPIHLDLLAPLLDPGKGPVGAILLRIDPSRFLYPLIQTWPTPSPSGETLLVRCEGEDVLYLNELRHQQGTALLLRRPAGDEHLVSAAALRGIEGITEGHDYRGVSVLAATRHVPDTGWQVVAKIDAEEALGPLRDRARTILPVVGLLILMAAALTLFWARRREVAFVRHQLEAEEKRLLLLQRNDHLARHANDIILCADSEGRIVDANERALAAYGYSRDDICRLTARDLRAPSARADLEAQWRASQEKDGLLFETVHQRRDGTPFPVEVSQRAIEVGGQCYHQAIVRDVSERKRAEAALHESEERLATTLNSIGDAVLVTDREGRVERMNPVAERLTGWPADEARGRLVTEVFRIVKEKTRRQATNPVERVLSGGAVVGLANHTLLIARDGTERPISDSGAPIRDSAGRIRGVVLVFRDATREREAQRAVAYHAELLFHLDEAVLATDSQFRVRAWNRAAAALYGCTPEETLGRPVSEVIQPQWVGHQRAESLRALEETGRFRGDLVALRHDGRPIHVEATVVALQDEEGRVTGYVAVHRDVSERVQAQRALRESEERFRLLASRAPAGILQSDLHGDCLFVNERWQEMTGLSSNEALGRGWLRGLHPEDRDQVAAQWFEAATRGRSFEAEYRFQTPQGKVTWVLGTGTAMRDEAGRVSGYLGIMADVTERRKMREHLAMTERLVSVGTLAAGVGHEINNPLTIILGNLGFAVAELRALVPSPGPAVPAESSLASRLEEVLRALEQAHQGADRVRLIVQSLSALSRAEDSPQGPVNVEQILESSIGRAHNEIRHRARLVRKYGGVPPVAASEATLGQVFLNLLVNAAQAIPEGKADQNEIRVATRVEADQRVVAEIRDTGVGIPAEIAGRIFDPFFTTKGIGEGTGLGLSICHRIVTELGGDIQVESEPGKGSVFRVLLPLAPPSTPAVASEQKSIPSGRRGRILVLDDEEMILVAVRRMLHAAHEVETLTSARVALARVAAGERYDLILCDLMMPEMTGMDLYEELERLAPTQAERMLFFTGGAFSARAHEFLQRVPNRTLEKPLTKSQLLAIIRERLG